jgi:hypothetical protein
VAVLLTSEVSVDDLPEDEILRLTPGIFQARIDKAHEPDLIEDSRFPRARAAW